MSDFIKHTILLWAISNDERLSKKAKKLIDNADNEIFYSIISLWEVELKRIAHTDVMPVSAQQIAGYCQQSGFQRLVLKEKHIYTLAGLKREETAPPHKDSFDRILICQASTENMMFVTHDSLMLGYNEPCILVV